MAWQIRFTAAAEKSFGKLNPQIQKQILHYLKNRVLLSPGPRTYGKPLIGDKMGLWRYRVQDYRILCRIEDDALVILIIKLGHRKEVYD